MKNESLKNDLKKFQSLWDDALNGDHSNHGELSRLATKIKDMQCSDKFIYSYLSPTEQITYRYALLLANYK